MHVFQERTITTALRAARDALWPGGMMSPPRVPPTPAEAKEIRRTAEIAALNVLPGISILCIKIFSNVVVTPASIHALLVPHLIRDSYFDR